MSQPPPPSPDMRAIMAQWQEARERYDMLNHAINALFARYGTSDKMTPEAIAEYRELQRGRDEAYNIIIGLEMQFFNSDEVL